MSSRVQTLPPTLGVKDPEVRSFLDALANAWDHRSGIIDKSSPDRFITADEFKELASQAVVETLGSAVGAIGAPGSGGPGSVASVISTLSDEIKKSLLYQILGTPYGNINLSDLQQKINASVDQAAAFFAQERQARANADEALTNQLTIQASQIGQNQAAITTETQTRVNKDNAIAAAVNNIWAAIGGNNAVIQDGALAQVAPSGSQATRWTQVQSEVIDPNTGQSRVASIRQDFSAFSDKVNNKFGSMYTVRAQVTSGGRTVVGGFGLSALDGPGGPTIDFGVRADTFWIGNLSGVGDIPFVVQTSATTVNGVTRPAGVYIKDAFIANGTIDTAKIANAAIDTAKIKDASITSAKIGVAEVDTLRIRGQAVTVPFAASGGYVSLNNGLNANTWITLLSVSAESTGSPAIFTASITDCNLMSYPSSGNGPSDDVWFEFGLFINGAMRGITRVRATPLYEIEPGDSTRWLWAGSVISGGIPLASLVITPPAGFNAIELKMRCSSSLQVYSRSSFDPAWFVNGASVGSIECKR